MNALKIAAQIIGYIAIAESVLVFISTKREKILIFKLIDDVLWFFNMLFMGNYTGAVLNAIAVGRELVFFNRGRKKWASHKFWLFFFMAVMLVSPILTWAGPVSILPAAGSAVAVICFYAQKPIMTKCFAYFAQGAWLAYAILTTNTASTVCNVIALVSATIGLIHELIVKRKAKRNAILKDYDKYHDKDFIPQTDQSTETASGGNAENK